MTCSAVAAVAETPQKAKPGTGSSPGGGSDCSMDDACSYGTGQASPGSEGVMSGPNVAGLGEALEAPPQIVDLVVSLPLRAVLSWLNPFPLSSDHNVDTSRQLLCMALTYMQAYENHSVNFTSTKLSTGIKVVDLTLPMARVESAPLHRIFQTFVRHSKSAGCRVRRTPLETG